jgi:hypothetical protein
LPFSASSTMMTMPITVTVTGSGSKDRAMCLSVRNFSSPVGVTFKLARMPSPGSHAGGRIRRHPPNQRGVRVEFLIPHS